MKRIITYIAVAVALMAMSCTRESLNETKTSGNSKLTIQLISSELQTRAEKAGEDDPWKENTISWFDYFFFSDAEGTKLLYKGRVAGDTQTFLTDVGDPYENLREGAYVYVLANYPTSDDNVPSVSTLEEILALPLSTDFQAGYNGKTLSFVMDNYADGSLTKIKASKPNDETKVSISLSRIAAKLTMTINVLKEITRTTGEGENAKVLESWTPVLDKDHFFAYFVNADKTNTVAGEPQSRTDGGSGGYFTYDTKHGYTAQDDVTYQGKSYYSFLTDPAYTYPQTWAAGANGEPYFKIQMGWNSTLTGMVPLYYKVAIPIAEKDEDNNVVFTLNRNTWYHLTVYVTVLGGALNDYVIVDQTYCVADFASWTSPSEDFGTAGSSARFFDVPTLSYNLYSLNELKINFICNEGSTAAAKITRIEYYNYGEGTPSTGTPVSSTPPGDAASTFSYTESTERRTYALEVVDNGEDKYVKFTHDITDLYVQRVITVRIYKMTNGTIEPNIYRDVTIIQHPAIELKKTTAGDVFVNGYYARVARVNNVAPDGYAGYYNQNSTRYYYSYNNSGQGGGNYDPEAVQTGYGEVITGSNLDGTISKDYYTMDISVTAFSSNNNHYEANSTTIYYKIGDPRVDASSVYNNFSLNGYYNGRRNYQNVLGNWTSSGKIKICTQNPADQNFIAPRFLVSSALNANERISFENAVKRGATYQEAGYPAGRWRLPTEAEMAFIAARQKEGIIPTLYATNTVYWAGSGRQLTVPATSATEPLNLRFDPGSGNHSMRFVYDLWYWGDEPFAKGDKTNPNATPLSTNEYHPNQHEY